MPIILYDLKRDVIVDMPGGFHRLIRKGEQVSASGTDHADSSQSIVCYKGASYPVLNRNLSYIETIDA